MRVVVGSYGNMCNPADLLNALLRNRGDYGESSVRFAEKTSCVLSSTVL